MTFTVESLRAAAAAWRRADNAHMAARPPGCPRGAWRSEGVYPPVSFAVRDSALKSRPSRLLLIDAAADCHSVTVWRPWGSAMRFAGRIEFDAVDANERLSRFVPT
jgi:hypothetical protein